MWQIGRRLSSSHPAPCSSAARFVRHSPQLMFKICHACCINKDYTKEVTASSEQVALPRLQHTANICRLVYRRPRDALGAAFSQPNPDRFICLCVPASVCARHSTLCATHVVLVIHIYCTRCQCQWLRDATPPREAPTRCSSPGNCELPTNGVHVHSPPCSCSCCCLLLL